MLEFQKDAEKIVENLKEELGKIRTSRASEGILDTVTVPYYGQESPIKNCAAINIPNPKTIEIHPWDVKMTSVISTAILKANIGFTPQVTGNIVRLNMPPMTGERRNQVKKIAASIGEEHKVSVRNLRRKKMSELNAQEHAKEISKDQLRASEKEIQKIVDAMTKSIDELRAKKEQEIDSE
ncbi:MAG: ribosome recycling factor [Elusimicrobia bacterium CG03_land_8_20_14_0_80_50_18]|nr:MAG: ribosome recycling factor [Elusimicrobia bacterium CG03_land_8_20_14_0_80_50_18]PIX16295.1 MAG: ribosome recycling factor [Elusimicrobia bacterium CG_4_8_14_3_um_filter_50_9]